MICIALSEKISWITEFVKHLVNTGQEAVIKRHKKFHTKKIEVEIENGESEDDREEESEDDREEEKLDVNEGQNQDDEDATISVFDKIFEILRSSFAEE